MPHSRIQNRIDALLEKRFKFRFGGLSLISKKRFETRFSSERILFAVCGLVRIVRSINVVAKLAKSFGAPNSESLGDFRYIQNWTLTSRTILSCFSTPTSGAQLRGFAGFRLHCCVLSGVIASLRSAINT